MEINYNTLTTDGTITTGREWSEPQYGAADLAATGEKYLLHMFKANNKQ